jgi:methylated-DNA-[protein]-cysteine S-methyltransferase
MQKKQDKTNYDACLKTPFATLGLRFDKGKLVGVDFVEPGMKVKAVTAESKNACKQIKSYCSKKPSGKCFNIKVKPTGTQFQKKVWGELQKIPVGTVVTYGELAKRLKTSARAVGNACRKNPVPIVVPCHRVVSKVGLGGYAGRTAGEFFKIKEWLLNHERAISGS